jgi:hypothetical protein
MPEGNCLFYPHIRRMVGRPGPGASQYYQGGSNSDGIWLYSPDFFFPNPAFLVLCRTGFNCRGDGGVFKANISVLVGALYAEGSPLKDAAFNIFYMGVNVGATLSPPISW